MQSEVPATAVARGRIRLREHPAATDESTFMLVALVGGAIVGCILALL